MTIIAAFWFCLLSIFCLLFLKYLETKNNKRFKVLMLLSYFDNFSAKIINFMQYRVLQIRQTTKYIFVVYIPYFLRQKSKKYKESVNARIINNKDILMGRRDIENKGSASFFLRKIDESKRNGKKGAINDCL